MIVIVTMMPMIAFTDDSEHGHYHRNPHRTPATNNTRVYVYAHTLTLFLHMSIKQLCLCTCVATFGRVQPVNIFKHEDRNATGNYAIKYGAKL